jgi:hypothetical protein
MVEDRASVRFIFQMLIPEADNLVNFATEGIGFDSPRYNEYQLEFDDAVGSLSEILSEINNLEPPLPLSVNDTLFSQKVANRNE